MRNKVEATEQLRRIQRKQATGFCPGCEETFVCPQGLSDLDDGLLEPVLVEYPNGDFIIFCARCAEGYDLKVVLS